VSDGFNWDDPTTVIVPNQMAVAVYFNPSGNVVVRQENDCDDDPFIVLTPENACRVAFRILDLVEETDPVAHCKGGHQARRPPPTTPPAQPGDDLPLLRAAE